MLLMLVLVLLVLHLWTGGIRTTVMLLLLRMGRLSPLRRAGGGGVGGLRREGTIKVVDWR
jgi:hypothetical protein